jgi:sensor c-di-GMP phosphodiesterase-like protein
MNNLGQQVREQSTQKITVNLEDAVLQEQKLFAILEVSYSDLI